MASFGKKIIAAFLEVDEKKAAGLPPGKGEPELVDTAVERTLRTGDRGDDRFAGHFDQLLSEANIAGPDYYEFARMIAVMRGIPDEAARYNAAFAGLQVQGLNKQQLLDTAAEYVKVLTTDAGRFQATVNASYEEKVRGKEAEAEEKAGRIHTLSQEILQLQQRIGALQEEVRVSKEKLAGSSGAYSAESKRRQQEIRRDIEKINQYIH